MALSWLDWVKQAVSAGGTGALTLGAAASGYAAFGSGDNGKLFPYSIVDGTAWETGLGTYTHAGTSFARTSRTASSTGSALNVTTSAFVMVDMMSTTASAAYIGGVGTQPGGRLTLSTGVPVTTADVTGATTIYYTPYLSNVITLWDGNAWLSVEFAEVSLALGTITSGRPYDVFGFLSSGALSTELLAWTSDTARATAITIQDGRYCKSGDKTRLYLGTFRTTGTTTTEDSLNNRYVFNMYNRVLRMGYITDSPVAFSYSTSTWRAWNGYTFGSNPTKFCNFIVGLLEDSAHGVENTISDGNHYHGLWINGTSPVNEMASKLTTSFKSDMASQIFLPALGLNSVTEGQYGNSDANNWRTIRVQVLVRQ